jgi:prevent-host-death family protein
MKTVAASEFSRNFGQYQRQAQREPVAVTSHGSPTGYFISAADFEEFQRLQAEQRRAYHPSELPKHLQKAIRNAKMDRRHARLDELLRS